jgi:Cu(I)/Ag(I) efflux system membrane fusion protein
MKRAIAIALGALVAGAAGVGGGYWLAMHRTMSAAMPASAMAPATPGDTGRKPLYWHDPMYPQQRFDKPGRSPFMDMDLVPVYGDAAGGDSGVAVSSRVLQNLGVRTAEVREGTLEQRLEAVGAVGFDERNVAVVQARVNGFVERLLARAPLDAVAKGQALAEILAPEWVAAQEEYLALRRSALADDGLRRAARQRLALLGMAEEAIAAVEAEGRTRSRITLTSPLAGVITELGARDGMTVAPGTTLFRINSLATVWVTAQVPESRAGMLQPGMAVEATVPAYPGEKFTGRMTAILPEVDAATRTVKARVELANPGGRLKPGMYATVRFAPRGGPAALLVPSEAVIRTGRRDVVMVAEPAEGGQRFRAVEVEAGAEGGGMTEVRKGLQRGMKVVTSGQFLLDSEASLKAGAARMEAAPAAGPPPAADPGAGHSPATVHQGEATVERIGKEAVTLSHGPIATLGMGAMTMDFGLPPGGLPAGVKEGARVSFAFRVDERGGFRLTGIRRLDETAK